jgi:hypothetical protein
MDWRDSKSQLVILLTDQGSLYSSAGNLLGKLPEIGCDAYHYIKQMYSDHFLVCAYSPHSEAKSMSVILLDANQLNGPAITDLTIAMDELSCKTITVRLLAPRRKVELCLIRTMDVLLVIGCFARRLYHLNTLIMGRGAGLSHVEGNSWVLQGAGAVVEVKLQLPILLK